MRSTLALTDRCTTELPARERAGGEQIAGGCHKTPDYQPGAAAITLRRYTHTLPGEFERARDGAGSVPRESGPDRRRHEIWLRCRPRPAFGPKLSALRISLRFRSLRRSPERFAPLYAGDFGLSGAVSKTVVGGFVHRGFESHPLRCRPGKCLHRAEFRRPSVDPSGASGGVSDRQRNRHFVAMPLPWALPRTVGCRRQDRTTAKRRNVSQRTLASLDEAIARLRRRSRP